MGQRQNAGQVREIQLIDVEAAEAFANLQAIHRVGRCLRKVVVALGAGQKDIEAFVGGGEQVRVAVVVDVA